MTDAIQRVGLQSGASQTVEVKQEDGQYKRSRLDEAISKSLLKSKANRKAFTETKQAEYKNEIASFTNGDAKKTAKNTTANEYAAARIDQRTVYVDEAKYNAAKTADAAHEHVYLDDKKIKQVIAENPEDFTNENGFSSDLYKQRIGMYTGFDNKGNLDERKAMSLDYGISKGKAGKMMKEGGYDVEKDLTLLYKSLAVLGVLGATGGVGAAIGVPFTSNVLLMENGAPATNPELIAGYEKLLGRPLQYDSNGYPILDTIKSVAGKGVPGMLKGMLGGIIPGIALAAVVKDNGGKDIFNGLSAEAIVNKGDKNIDKKISGKTNQKIMREILKMENISNEDKAFILKLAYGELTGKKVNDREMAAAYEIAKFCNKHPELDPKDYDKIPDQKVKKEGGDDDKVNEDDVTIDRTGAQVEDDTSADNTNKEDPCDLSVVQDGKIQDKQAIASHEYRPKKGEYWLSIVAAKYGVSGKEGLDVVHELKRLHGITDFSKNIQPSVMNLPEVIKIGDKEYNLNKDKDVTDKTTQFAAQEKYNGTFTNPFKMVEIPLYAVKGCKNETLESGLKSAETAKQKAQEIAKQNPNKYVFTPAQ